MKLPVVHMKWRAAPQISSEAAYYISEVKIEVSQLQCYSTGAEETCWHCHANTESTTFGTKTRQAAGGRSLKSRAFRPIASPRLWAERALSMLSRPVAGGQHYRA